MKHNKDQRAGDVASSRGASGKNINEMGYFADMTVGELAMEVAAKTPGAKGALKTVKEAQRLSQKYGGK